MGFFGRSDIRDATGSDGALGFSFALALFVLQCGLNIGIKYFDLYEHHLFYSNVTLSS